jgi:antirestriction protein
MTLTQTHILNQIDEKTPSIYVACLASYNTGNLYGQWIDCTQGYDTVMQQIQIMLTNSPEQNAEDFAIHTYHGFHKINLNEWEKIETVCEIAQKLDEYGDLAEIFSILYNDYHSLDEAINMFEDNYIGCYESELDFIYEYVENCCMLEGVSDTIKTYFDYKQLLADMQYGGEIFSILQGYKQHHYFYNR